MAIPKQTLMMGVGTSAIAGGGFGIYYLSQDRTIEDKLVSSGETLIKDTDEYEVAFMERRSNEDLIKEINTEKNNISKTSKAKEGGEALKTWCEEKIKLDLSKDNLDNVYPKAKEYCTKPSSTIEERLQKAKKELTKDWNKKLETLKNPPEKDVNLHTEIGVSSLEDNAEKVVEKALEKWCNTSTKTKLLEDKEDAIWDKVNIRCLQ